MQPCPVCGEMAIDANGYCVRCGTFRGQPQPVYPQQQPYAAPQPAPPTSAAPYPFSGPPISGGGYSAPPAPPPARNKYVLPLVASVAVLVLLIGAIVVVAIVRSGGKPNPPGANGSPSASVSAEPSSAIDACLVGTWTVSSNRQQVDIPSVGPVTFLGKGEVVHIHPDGEVDTDYSQSTPYTASYSGHVISATLAGTDRSTITTANGTITIVKDEPNGTVSFKLDGAPLGSAGAMDPDTDPAQYSCLNNTANLHTSRFDETLTKTSPNP
jgi:hypothetical protein